MGWCCGVFVFEFGFGFVIVWVEWREEKLGERERK